ncbi:hypothetical protein K450DRAFT_250633 [Umbelopsis ramanniana AG]|uniref:Uncharacterized protein n=1 Tax=Umbelopsis ramanniana AG TaxID=1314678 RepID=A0AAD5E6M8_UMBRA|nr:uncharacterized protein K450DRAFT_250633 [Umbelopsis ramanniana AG]KAI8577749.1 hypothetical protein K450DRAFT_250633 [Umbelopsis ramanniana AG]
MNDNDMDSFLYLRDNGFEGDGQKAQGLDHEQAPATFMEDQRPSWPDHDALDNLHVHHDVTHFLLPMETEDWSILDQSQLLTDQSMFAQDKPPTINASDVEDMIYQQSNNQDLQGQNEEASTQNTINRNTRMSTRSRTRQMDKTPTDDYVNPQQDSTETAEPKRKTQKSKKLYCICQQPYDGSPMVQCDSCQEW